MGFCNYRFDTEDEWLVLYVYELQIINQYRKKGLGKFLLMMTEKLAEIAQMQCVMLTVLKRNELAESFYTKNGYSPSTIDPSYVYPKNAKKYDYRILQKFISVS